MGLVAGRLVNEREAEESGRARSLRWQAVERE